MGTWRWTFCFHRFLWVVLGLYGDGRDAGQGNRALGLHCACYTGQKIQLIAAIDLLISSPSSKPILPKTLLDLVILFLQTCRQSWRHTMLAWIWLMLPGFPYRSGEQICSTLERDEIATSLKSLLDFSDPLKAQCDGLPWVNVLSWHYWLAHAMNHWDDLTSLYTRS